MTTNTYIVTYDIVADAGAPAVYQNLYNTIKTYPGWAHITESCWAVQSDNPAIEIRNRLRNVIRATDRLMVVQSAHIAAWHNTICNNDWLKESI